MTVTREELEAIWNEKPYGYMDKLKAQLKKRKNESKFIVETLMYESVVKDSVVSTVWAKDYLAAQGKVHDQHVLELRKRHGKQPWDAWNAMVSYKSVSTKTS